MKTLKYLEIVDGQYSVEVRDRYFCQMQLGMHIAQVYSCDFIIYSSFDNSCKVINVKYQKKIVLDYIGKLRYIYFCYMFEPIMNKFKELSQRKTNNLCIRNPLENVTNCKKAKLSFD